jgi:hypothetical protein
MADEASVSGSDSGDHTGLPTQDLSHLLILLDDTDDDDVDSQEEEDGSGSEQAFSDDESDARELYIRKDIDDDKKAIRKAKKALGISQTTADLDTSAETITAHSDSDEQSKSKKRSKKKSKKDKKHKTSHSVRHISLFIIVYPSQSDESLSEGESEILKDAEEQEGSKSRRATLDSDLSSESDEEDERSKMQASRDMKKLKWQVIPCYCCCAFLNRL